MIKRILSFFEEASKQSERSNSHDILLASLALLIEVAKSDHNVDHIEQQEVVDLAIKTFGIEAPIKT